MGAHAEHRMHEHSLEAHAVGEAAFGKRAQAIYDLVRRAGPRTDRQICAALGFGENLNAVRPRITELVERGALMEVGLGVKCPITGRTVRRVDIARPRGQVEMFS